MRLTLRTMLAYLDEILEPEDAEDIGKKIEESEFASSLVHRTRDCMRRLRLGAPALVGKGMANDANTVAEYLDNTLSADRVPEFEKICLESDVHLAEVGACHQILTLVLAEPAEIDPDSRDRMYQLIHKPPQAPSETPPPFVTPAVGSISTGGLPVAAATVEVAKRHKPEVPDYLRESRSRFWPMVAMLLVAATLLVAVMSVVGPPGVRAWMNSLIAMKPAENSDENQDEQDQGARQDRSNSATDETASKDRAADAAAADDRESVGKQATDDARANRVGDVQLPRKTTGQSNDDESNDDVDAPEPGDVPSGDGDAMPDDPDRMAGNDAADSGDEALGPAPEPGDDGPPAKVAPVKPAVGDAQRGRELGRYISDHDVLLVFDKANEGWQRLPARAIVAGGDRLLTLPSFRSTVTLSSGIRIQVTGPSQFEFENPDDRGVPGIAIEFGRISLLTLGKAGNQIRVRLGDRTGLLTFGDADAEAALEVRYILVPGKDPETGPGVLAADLFATSGQIRWEEDGREIRPLQAPDRRTLTDLAAYEGPGNEFPKWIRSEIISDLDKRAAITLEHDLTGDKPISLTLKELADGRKKEVKSLAIRSSAYVGKFDPFVAALKDEDQRVNWPLYIEALRSALARGPEMATQVRASFEKQRAGDAPELYRMLWGYSVDDLRKGADAKLVDYLSHPSLDFRVLSSWNLQSITGLSGFYRPDYTEAKRRPQVLKWKEKLKDGKIVPPGTQPSPKTTSIRTRPPLG